MDSPGDGSAGPASATDLAGHPGVRSLLDAVVSIGADLDLQTVLHRILDVAKTLLDCRYAALGVIGEDGQLAEFIPLGLDEDEIARIDHWPHGRGLLGLLVREPQSLRLADVSDHPDSYGFPEGHPHMRRFLGVPIRIRDEVFGNLYLTEKSGGREFDEHDEAVASALAAAAGVAIDNARLYEESRARESWLEASAELGRLLLGGADRRDALALMARRARDLGRAEVAIVVAHGGDGAGVEAADGVEGLVNERVAGLPNGADAPVHLADLSAEETFSQWRARLPAGPGLILPLRHHGPTHAWLILGRRAGGLPFSASTVRVLLDLGRQASMVMELAEARREAELYELMDDRERIGRDLHDIVIQQIYAVGMSLTAAMKLIDGAEATHRIQQAIEVLDDTIRQIRSTIFAVQSGVGTPTASLSDQVATLVEGLAEQLGFAPRLRLLGPIDTDVPDSVGDEALSVLRECLTNVVRHARASSVVVTVAAGNGDLSVDVTDDGVGLPQNPLRSGLANLAERAARLGGSFEAHGADPGTVVQWRVPTDP